MSDTFALRGGKKVVTVKKPHVTRPPQSYEDESDALKLVRDRKYLTSDHDPVMNEFTGLFLDSLDNQAKHALFFSSMYESLYALCKVLDIGEGDEIVCSPHVGEYVEKIMEMLGCKVNYYSVDEKGRFLDKGLLQDVCTEYTRCVIVTHSYGFPEPIDDIRELLGEGVMIIEDCTHGHGVLIAGKPAGTLGDVGFFPLGYESLVFTGQGVGCVTSNGLLYDCLKSRKNKDERNVVFLGSYKQAISSFHGVIGKYSLRHRNHIMQGAQRCYMYLQERLASVSYLEMIPDGKIGKGSKYSYRYRFICRYDPSVLRNLPVESLITLLQSEGVEISFEESMGAISQGCAVIRLPHFYDWYSHKDVIDQYIAAFRKVQLNLFC